MEIKLPTHLRNDVNSYNFFCKMMYLKDTFYNTSINLNFEGLEFIEGNLCTVLASCIDQLFLEHDVTYSGLPNKIKEIFQRNCFSEKLCIPSKIDYFNTTIKYRETHKDDEEEFAEYVYSELLENQGMPYLSEGLKEKVNESVFELLENAKTHGNSERIFTCGQYFPRKKKLLFTIANIGTTVKENVIQLEPDYDSIQSIFWALEYTNSTKVLLNGLPGGAGLSILENFIKINSGKLQIISDNGFFERKFSDSEVFCENSYFLDYKFPGTVITLEINIDDGNYIFENDDIHKFL